MYLPAFEAHLLKCEQLHFDHSKQNDKDNRQLLVTLVPVTYSSNCDNIVPSVALYISYVTFIVKNRHACIVPFESRVN